ncbi:hypothetical protein GSO30_003576 [Salmonella enterica]|nr:hypothetical protein [Salmonella enterica]
MATTNAAMAPRVDIDVICCASFNMERAVWKSPPKNPLELSTNFDPARQRQLVGRYRFSLKLHTDIKPKRTF